jgi:hypothetical protein
MNRSGTDACRPTTAGSRSVRRPGRLGGCPEELRPKISEEPHDSEDGCDGRFHNREAMQIAEIAQRTGRQSPSVVT